MVLRKRYKHGSLFPTYKILVAPAISESSSPGLEGCHSAFGHGWELFPLGH